MCKEICLDGSGPVGNPMIPISIQDLTFIASGKMLVKVDSLEISDRGATVVLGPNGAGKSLFLRMLHGLIPPTTGTISFNRVGLGQCNRQHQAMVFQRPVLLRRSVSGNVTFALKQRGIDRSLRRERLRQLLAKGGLSELANQPARSLSGGEQQRLAIIRALATEPKILFLDEPTSSLDPAASEAIEVLIYEVISAGIKVIMITHDLRLAQKMAHTIIFFHKGVVCEQSDGSQFFRSPKSQLASAFLASKLALWGG